MDFGRILMAIIFAVLILSCCSNLPNDITGEFKAAIPVAGNDEEMNQAIAEAQATLDQFISYFEEASPKHKLSLKAKFSIQGSDAHYEQLWLNNLIYDGDTFIGVVASMPLYVQTISYLDLVKVDPEYVTDWMIVENGHVIGGYTVKLLRARMTPEERDKFDEENGLIFDE